MDLIEYINNRIAQLRYLDEEYHKMAQDEGKPTVERVAARDAANEIFSRRQELESVLRMYPKVELVLTTINKPMLN